MGGPLGHLRVVEISTTLAGAQAGTLLADFGADVVAIEPPGGSPLRSDAVFPYVARGKKSVVLDLHDAHDAETARRLITGADVLITTLRPRSLERFGLGYEAVSALNPRLVYASITGWGRTGPLKDAKGYEALVLAKLGAMATSYAPLSTRPGPTFVSVPFASWSASHALLQGVFAALRERETSGVGQRVDTNLPLALSIIDPWNQVVEVITQRFPDAFLAAPPMGEDGVPNSSFTFRLLVASTKDGHWLQFSQVQPHLFKAFINACGLAWMYEDPRWRTLPEFEDRAQRVEFWNILFSEVHKRTLAEWQEIFDNDRDVFAEIFRRGTDLLHHPQMVHGRHTVVLRDAERGDVLQPAALIKMERTPAAVGRSAPRLDEHGAELRARAAAAPAPAPDPATAPEKTKPPLDGVTVLELGTFYAAPGGVTVLTDLGARVIKIEPLEGDPMRAILPFPEAGAMKVLQGKESVALDLGSAEARQILHKIAAGADLVLCSFRAGVADRLGVGARDLLAVNPGLVYLDAPGYGIDGPYGNSPAFAPTMSAGSGLAMRNAGRMVPEDNPDDLAVLRGRAIQLTSAGGGSATQPDGVAALVVGTALCFGAYLQKIGGGGQHMLTTMLNSCAHALSQSMVEYDNRPQIPEVDDFGYGFNALYRLYETGGGWVMLAAPSPGDWRCLTAVPAFAGLAADTRFATAEARRNNDAALAEAIGAVLASGSAADWERDLLAADVGCVVADPRTVEANYVGDLGRQHGYLVSVEGPYLGEYPRMAPITGFSRSSTSPAAGPTLGQHTEAVLREFGYGEDAVKDLTARGVVICG